MPVILPVTLCIACAVCLLIGIRILFAPETKEKSYIPAKATVTTRLLNDCNDVTPRVQFTVNGKAKTARFRSGIPRSVHSEPGSEIDILYCYSPIMFIDAYTVVLDDEGKSMKSMIRFYRAMGVIITLVGLLLIIPIVLILK